MKRSCVDKRGAVKKREGYLQWEEYFMAVAFLSAQRSKDPSSQVKILPHTHVICPHSQAYPVVCSFACTNCNTWKASNSGKR